MQKHGKVNLSKIVNSQSGKQSALLIHRKLIKICIFNPINLRSLFYYKQYHLEQPVNIKSLNL
jgi:hypothetical protein